MPLASSTSSARNGWSAWLDVSAQGSQDATAIAASDHILLPSSALQQLHDAVSMDKPLLFIAAAKKIAKPEETVACSVHDFSAPEGTAVIPGWMRDHLQLREGSKIWLQLVSELPTAEFCRFQVLDGHRFLSLPNHKAILERALEGNYRTLTESTSVVIKHLGHAYTLNVTELQPEKQCSLLDADLEVDLFGTTTEASSQEREDGQVLLDSKAGTRAHLRDHKYTTLKLTLPAAIPFRIEYHMRGDDQTDAEIYVAPASMSNAPTQTNFAYTCTQQPYDRQGTIDVSNVQETEWYIGMRAYGCKEATGVVTASSLAAAEEPASEGSPNGFQATVPGGDTQRCDHCGKDVPTMSFARHVAFCRRHNVVCERCQRVLHRNVLEHHFHCDLCAAEGVTFSCDTEHARKKHLELFHSSLRCDCGAELTMLSLASHRSTECPLRVMTCRFCFNTMRAGKPAADLRDRMAGLTQHESECGSRTESCHVCGARIRLKDMETHQAIHRHDAEQRGTAPKSATFIAQPVKDLEAQARLREQAWARAGFHSSYVDSSTTDTEDMLASMRESPSSMVQQPTTQPEIPEAVVETQPCANVYCTEQTTSELGVCRTCRYKIAEFAGQAGDIDNKNDFGGALVRAYYFMSTIGCGNEACRNEHCRSSSSFSGTTEGSALAVQCVQRAREYTGKSPRVYVCSS
eukprot:m.107817 g.107817  ORF g.107817 m.107817 type:complete len:688 (+) comp15199_c1_seq4:127-2190(+)